MKIRSIASALACAALLLILAVAPKAHAQAWIELVAPAQATYQAPATYQFQIKSGVVGTGPKAEFLTDMRLLRNNVAVSTLPVGTYTESGISTGTYEYVLKATAVRYINGDEQLRFLTSPVFRITVNAPPAPFDGAEYVSSNYPRSMDRGLSYQGSVTFRNAGNTTWRAGDGYRLGQAPNYSSAHFGVGEIAVPHDVPPGGTAQFSFNATAPMAVGDYLLQWQMNRNGTRFGSTSGTHTVTVGGKYNHATSYEQEVPTSMIAGRTYRVKYRFRNGGNTTWSSAAGYSLGSWNPANNTTWGVGRVPVRDQVSGGIGAVFEFDVVAPSLPGTYGFQWRMVEEGVEWFGEPTPNVQIVVSGPPSEIVGNIDEVSNAGVIRGWACSTRIDASVDVHVYVGGAAGSGTFALSGTANEANEAAVNSACSAGGSHRFSLQMSNALRQQHAGKSIHVHGISPVGQPNRTIGGSGNFVVPAAPSGTISSNAAACTLAAGAQSCSLRLTWSANDSRTQVVRGLDGGVLAGGLGGVVDVAIPVGVSEFKLLAGGDVLARVSVTGKAAPVAPGTPSHPAATLARRYVYDEMQLLCKIIEPESGATVLGYDAAGRLIWSAQGLNLPDATKCNRDDAQVAARRVTRSYDNRGRVRTVSYPDGLGNLSMDYALDGALLSARSYNQGQAQVVTTRSYNSLRALQTESQKVADQPERTVTLGYNALGQVTSTQYPDGYVVKHAYNALGQILSVTDAAGLVLAGNIRHAPSGAITALTFGNGVVRSAGINARQMIANLQEGNVLSLAYEYDEVGNPARITDAIRGTSGQITARYDALNRLVQADSAMFGGNGSYSFDYDTLDNMVFSRLPGKRERTFHYDAKNRLELLRDEQGSGVTGFGYDVAGNMTQRNGQAFVFDMGGRLRSTGSVQGYFYDSAGYRAAATGPNSPTWLYLDGRRLIHATEGDTKLDYIYAQDQLMAIRSAGPSGASLKYLHYDAMNNLAGITDAAGNVVQRFSWSPYGQSDQPVPVGIPGFAGHLVDSESGLVYMGQRFYDPQTSRFLSVDPVATHENPAGAFNRYWYASSNPYRHGDPDGRQVCVFNSGCDRDKQLKDPVLKYVSLGGENGQLGRLLNKLAPEGTYDAEGDPTLADLKERAYAVLEKAPGADGVVDLTWPEVGVILQYESAKTRNDSKARGGYENLSDTNRGLIYANTDSIFYGKYPGGTLYRVTGNDGKVRGPYLGGDFNYLKQGIIFRAGNDTRGEMRNAIRSWNWSGEGTKSNLSQRLFMADVGYYYFHKYGSK
jgi:RHS repeat-associated protein